MNGIPRPLVVLYLYCLRCYQVLHHLCIPLFKKEHTPKVFCIGYVKTGTNSVYHALRKLGYRTVRLLRIGLEPKNGWVFYIKKLNYDAFTDFPMNQDDLYKKLDKAFPTARFILTVRNPQSFVKSYVNYFRDSPRKITTADQYAQLLDEYNRYNAEVIKYFKDKPNQLLVLNLAEDDGWKTLCTFLQKQIPTTPFPYKNKARYAKQLPAFVDEDTEKESFT